MRTKSDVQPVIQGPVARLAHDAGVQHLVRIRRILVWETDPAIVVTLISVVVPAPASSLLVIALLLRYSLFIAATLQVSDSVSYREGFHANETLAPLSRDS